VDTIRADDTVPDLPPDGLVAPAGRGVGVWGLPPGASSVTDSSSWSLACPMPWSPQQWAEAVTTLGLKIATVLAHSPEDRRALDTALGMLRSSWW
jgi:hypothetical protein